MDLEKLFVVLNKAADLAVKLGQNGKDFLPAVNAIKNIVSKRPEDVTDDDLDDVETDLDEALDEFEKPLTRKE